MDAVATLTGLDEQNILMSLYAGQVSKAKIITKITRDPFEDIVENMDVGSVFYPRYIAAEAVVRYVRAMANSTGSNVETLYSIVGDKAEALEFRVSQGSRVSGIPCRTCAPVRGFSLAPFTGELECSFPGARIPSKRETLWWWLPRCQI